MEIFIPNSAFLGNIESFTKHFNPKNPGSLIVASNQKWISVHPLIISMSIALAEEVRQRGGQIYCQNFNAKSRGYLLRMGLMDAVNPDHGLLIEEHEESGRFIKARNIRNSQELNQFITDMVPLLHTTVEQAYPIKYVMSELVRNVLEHSQSSIGAVVSAQYFAKSNRISIGVADRGMGIMRSINQSYTTRTDQEAIALALRPGVTGTTKKIGGTEFNAGAGLFFTKSIAKVSRDFFFIYSGNSFYKLLKTSDDSKVRLNPDPNRDRATFRNDLPYWQGTAVGIDISMDLNQDFQDLLELIRDAYQLDVKQAQKTKYKKAKFI